MQENSHWYDRDGVPHHNLGIKEAREQNLFYSVTTIAKAWPAEALQKWKVREGVRIAFEQMKEAGRIWSLEEIQEAVKEAMEANLEASAIIGRRVHEQAEQYLSYGEFGEEEEGILKLCEPFAKWVDENVVGTEMCETILVNRCFGYAGTVDWVGEVKGVGKAIIDFKCREVKKKSPYWSDQMLMQMVAYRMCLPDPESYTLGSMVIDRAKPGVFVKWWNPKFYLRAWNDFKACYELTCRIRRHKPQIQYELGFCEAAAPSKTESDSPKPPPKEIS